MSSITLAVRIQYGLPGQPMHYLTQLDAEFPPMPSLKPYSKVEARLDGELYGKPVSQILAEIERDGFSQVAAPKIYVGSGSAA